MSLTKKKVTILALSFITAISTLFGALLLTPNTVKADNMTDEEKLAIKLSTCNTVQASSGSDLKDWFLITMDTSACSLTINLKDMQTDEKPAYYLLFESYYEGDTLKLHADLVDSGNRINVATYLLPTKYNSFDAYYVKLNLTPNGYDLTNCMCNTISKSGAECYILPGTESLLPGSFILNEEYDNLLISEKELITSDTSLCDTWLYFRMNIDFDYPAIWLGENVRIFCNPANVSLYPSSGTGLLQIYRNAVEDPLDMFTVDITDVYFDSFASYYFKIPSGTYTGTFADGSNGTFVFDENTRTTTCDGTLYKVLVSENIVEPEPERPDPGAGVPGLARYEKHYISGQYWRVYGSRTVACDSNMRLELFCNGGTYPLDMYTPGSDNKVQVGFSKNDIIQYQYKEKGVVVYTDFFMPETIKATNPTTGAEITYSTSNLVIHSDFVDYIYLITDPQTVCPTVYAQVNVTPEEPGQSPTLPGEPDFPSTEDPSNPGTDDPSNPGASIVIEESKFGDILKEGLLELTDWFNDNTGLGVSSSIFGIGLVVVVIMLLRRRR